MTITCLDGHPQKFIREKLQDDQTSKISQYTVFVWMVRSVELVMIRISYLFAHAMH